MCYAERDKKLVRYIFIYNNIVSHIKHARAKCDEKTFNDHVWVITGMVPVSQLNL